MTAKDELLRLAGLLTEYEASHLLSLFERTVVGDRYWEGDVAVFYNEYVKARAGLRSADHAVSGGMDGSGIFAPVPVVTSFPDLPRTALRDPEAPAAGLGDVLKRRRSRREFSSTPLDVPTLSTLLGAACGTTGFASAYGYDRLPLRAFPSCGGLQAPETFVSVQHVEGLDAGLYHYQPVDHALELLRAGSAGRELADAALHQPWVEQAAVVVLVTGRYDRLQWKYGERAYRFMCIDCGLLAQNVHLVGESLGLGVCAIAGFHDDVVERLFNVDGRREMAMVLIAVGNPL